ncbi:hypothetical protein DYB37_003348 [Aphanomyces astaci]|nr:hypothetical protein AaE_009654 [Aphanomyces astaci]RHX98125.1 hypothetical protein DYB36_002739 [Aphanomyces astaci]RHY22270.1 hypothetical protein DYB25_009948 [Aphanomyces astaci]RHY51440.1 hypothetical protein DYB38_001021 [Aphanomyces astaci]RHY57784.1 hypothetical protein DYB34_002224 [Aphanomyces astaci]
MSGVAPFIQSLMDMLESDSPCVSWNPLDKRAFDILDTKTFADAVLPVYFRHAKFTSFQRQLNYFGFRKQSRRHSAICTYAHSHYSMRVPTELLRIKRKVVKPKLSAALDGKAAAATTPGTSSGMTTPARSPTKSIGLAYTEASLAYAQAWSDSGLSAKWTELDMTPLPFERGADMMLEGGSGAAPYCYPVDDELANWVLRQF